MGNEQKTPLAQTLPLFATQQALNAINQLGIALPGHVLSVSGSIVTVNFDVTGVTLPQVTMPLFGSEYIRYPIQVGDKGVAFPASVYLGGVSGLGGPATAADFAVQQGNLSTLVWFPIANKGWSSVDPDALTMYGPNGVVLRDSGSNTVLTLTPSGLTVTSDTFSFTATTSISFTVGGHSVVIDSTGVTIDGVLFLLHAHSAVETGPDVSGPVVP
jgi:hypothetical protein